MAGEINGTSVWSDLNQLADARSSAPQPQAKNKLGKDDFVKLLLHQMQHQDPSAPVDSQQMVAQLAQFANLELQNTANSTLEAILMSHAAAQQTQVVSVVGKDVLFRTDKVNLAADGNATIYASIDLPAENVSVVIEDSKGNVIRQLDPGAKPAGRMAVEWDGKNERGERVPPGEYVVRVGAADIEGNALTVSQEARGHVSGVTFKDGVPELMIGGIRIKLPEVVEINERSTQ